MVTPLRGTLMLICGTAAMGASALLVSVIDADLIAIAALRCLLAVPMMLPMVLWELSRVDRSSALPRRTVIGALIAGLALGTDYVFWNFSIAEVGPGIATVLLNVQLIVLPLIAWAMEGTRPMPVLGLIIPVMFLGLVLVAGALDLGELRIGGVIFGLIAGTGYACYLAVIRRTAPATTKPAPFTVLALVGLSAGTAALIAGLVSGGMGLPATPADWGWLLLLAFLGQVVVYWFINTGMLGVQETVASVLLLLPGVFSLALAAVLLGDVPTPGQLIGCAIIILGAWWASAAAQRHQRRRAAEQVT